MTKRISRVEIIWLILAFLFVATSLYEGYLIIPGVTSHSVFSILQRAFVLLGPLAAIFAVVRGARIGLFSIVVLTAWLVVVGLTFWFYSPHQYYYEYYAWSQVGGYLIVLTLWILARYRNWFKAVILAAVPLYLIATILVSLYEIITTHHLPQSREGGLHASHIPTAFYYDPNNLGVAIALMLPFVVLAGLAVRRRYVWVISGIFTIALLYVLYKTGSRGGELSLVIDLIVLAIILPKPYRRYAQVLLGGLIVVLGGIILMLQAHPSTHLPFALEKISHIIHVFGVTRKAKGPGSVSIREALYLSGLHGLLQHPWGMGSRGAERYYRYWLTHHSRYNTYGVVDAHNMWLEVAMNFGFEGFVFYVAFYVSLIVGALKLTKSDDVWGKYIGMAGLSALIGFILGSLSPSSVMIGYNLMWVVYGIVLGGTVLVHRAPFENRWRDQKSPDPQLEVNS